MFLNFFGQIMTDKSEEVFHSVYYDSMWYLMPLKHQRLIYMMSIRSTVSYKLTVGNMSELSMEAAGIVSTIFYNVELHNSPSFIVATVMRCLDHFCEKK